MKRNDMEFIDDLDEAFAPLVEYAKKITSTQREFDCFMGSYMYMYTKDNTNFYKHVDTRKYMQLPRKQTA